MLGSCPSIERQTPSYWTISYSPSASPSLNIESMTCKSRLMLNTSLAAPVYLSNSINK